MALFLIFFVDGAYRWIVVAHWLLPPLAVCRLRTIAGEMDLFRFSSMSCRQLAPGESTPRFAPSMVPLTIGKFSDGDRSRRGAGFH
jgi:hypothetical protein